MFILKKSLLIYFIYFSEICYTFEKLDDLHSSITALEKIFQTEKLYIENSKKFCEYSSKILYGLKNLFKILKTGSTSNPKTEEEFANKLRFQYSLHDILNTNQIGFSKNISKYSDIYEFPDDIDLEGVTRAIILLQDVYRFSAKEIASQSFLKVDNGDVSNKLKLTSSECYLMGIGLFNIQRKFEAEEWLNLAYALYDNDEQKYVLKKIYRKSAILDILARIKFEHGDIPHTEKAIELMKEAILDNPTNKYLYERLHTYEKWLNSNKMNTNAINFQVEDEYCAATCRGEIELSSEQIKKLYCTYKDGKHPFLKLAPIKVEIQHLNPLVIVFHDVIYETEIDILKALSVDSLTRALLWDGSGTVPTLSFGRTGKYTVLENELHPVLNIINQRLEDMTDMSMKTSESLQIVNYGIGGHYGVHPDYLNDPADNKIYAPFSQYSWGNRIATVLFYMSDVEQGGATAFPHIKTAVIPKKGSAAFWYNMLPSGKFDFKSRHAGCPVIFGSKWVANKWIRYNGQIFHKKCTLNEKDYY